MQAGAVHEPFRELMKNLALIYRAFGLPRDRLALETEELPPLPSGKLRVAMLQAPINPSDLIPIRGAYAHRTVLPGVAGYEGVGRVVAAPREYSRWIGQRVLPLRGPGTWQCYVDCDPSQVVQAPEGTSGDVAARAYINPLAAWQMLARWPVAGRRVLLCGAGSSCADLLGHWARQRGASEVVGIYRSESRVRRMRALGITPVSGADEGEFLRQARAADIVFDSLGGPLASLVLDAMRTGSRFVGYGLLTGQPVRPRGTPRARLERFHLREALGGMSTKAWQHSFTEIWPMLAGFAFPKARFSAVQDWRHAVDHATRPGGSKPILMFDKAIG